MPGPKGDFVSHDCLRWRIETGEILEELSSRLQSGDFLAATLADCNGFLTQFILTPFATRLYNHAIQLHLELKGVVISSANHRRIAGIVALCYVLASTISGLWHSHAGDRHLPPCCESVVTDGSHHEHAGHGDSVHSHASHAGDVRPGCDHESCPMGDDDCVVCRFVAQSALATPPLAEPCSGVVVAEVRPIPPAAPIAAVLSCALARAPPAAA